MKVYLDYTQSELDRQYDQRSLVPDPSPWMTPCVEASSSAKVFFISHENISYGDHPDELLDIFLPDGAGPWPLVIFCHGGAWKALSKDEAGFPAIPLVPSGIALAALNFGLAPVVPLDVIVGQVRRAVVHLKSNAAIWNLDPDRFFAAGHSSGAHLASLLAVADWAALCGAPGLIKGLIAGSGPYDLEPVRLSARNDYLFLDEQTALALSPQSYLSANLPPAIFFWGGGELEEFQRQSRDLADAWASYGPPVARIFLEDLNHFQVGAEFLNTESAPVKAMIKMIHGRP